MGNKVPVVHDCDPQNLIAKLYLTGIEQPELKARLDRLEKDIEREVLILLSKTTLLSWGKLIDIRDHKNQSDLRVHGLTFMTGQEIRNSSDKFCFVSHKWLPGNVPDDGTLYTKMLRTDADWFWLDFCSLDVSRTTAQVAGMIAFMRHLGFSFLKHTHSELEYHRSAWCSIEFFIWNCVNGRDLHVPQNLQIYKAEDISYIASVTLMIFRLVPASQRSWVLVYVVQLARCRVTG